jgi:hypothetical protein
MLWSARLFSVRGIDVVLAKLAQAPQIQWKTPSSSTRQPSQARSALDPS